MSLTITTISSVNLELTQFAVKKSQLVLPYSNTLVFAPTNFETNDKHDYFKIPNDFNKIDYSQFCMKKLVNFVKTDFVCIVQYDGMAVNKNSWDDSFYEYDYIGSVGYSNNVIYSDAFAIPEFLKAGIKKKFVGGGGFSIRSKKLLDALQDDRFPAYLQSKNPISGKLDYLYCEDIFISVLYRKKLEKRYGIKFAPKKIARKFCSEFDYDKESLGFHGYYNFPLFFSEQDCLYYFSKLNRDDFHKSFLWFDKLIANAKTKNYNNLINFLQ